MIDYYTTIGIVASTLLHHFQKLIAALGLVFLCIVLSTIPDMESACQLKGKDLGIQKQFCCSSLFSATRDAVFVGLFDPHCLDRKRSHIASCGTTALIPKPTPLKYATSAS